MEKSVCNQSDPTNQLTPKKNCLQLAKPKTLEAERINKNERKTDERIKKERG